MTFLELVQELHRECGVAGSTVATVVNQTGESGRLVNWIKQAWHELQLEREQWWWMRKSFNLVTVAGDGTDAAADCTPAMTDLGEWKTDSFRIYRQAAGLTDEGTLSFKQYDLWRNLYALNAQSNQRPIFVTVKPDMSLGLGPAPDDIYVMTGDYFAAPGSMADDTDEPTGLPAQYQMDIVFRAGMKYAAFESAPEVYAYCKDRHDFYMARLELNQLDPVLAGAPLA